MAWSDLGKAMDDFCRSIYITDSHVHIGKSRDGKQNTIQSLIQYKSFGINEFFIFPFDETDRLDTMPFYRLGNYRISKIFKI